MVRPLPCHRTSFSEYPTALLGTIATPQDFLKAIGRSSETKLTPESWEELFHTNGHQLRKAGLTVEDRRYVPACSYMAGGAQRSRCSPASHLVTLRIGISSGASRSSVKGSTRRNSRTRRSLQARFEGKLHAFLSPVALTA